MENVARIILLSAVLALGSWNGFHTKIEMNGEKVTNPVIKILISFAIYIIMGFIFFVIFLIANWLVGFS